MVKTVIIRSQRLFLWLVILVASFVTTTAQGRESMTIAAPPSIWVQESGGKLEGPLMELLDNIFTGLEVGVTSKPLPWARAIEQMKSGEIDMIPVIFYTQEREGFMAFSEPFATVPTAVFVPTGKSFEFSSPADLVGKKGLIMRGDSISDEFEAVRESLNLTEIAGYDQMAQMLADQRADYAVAAQYGFVIQSKKSLCDSKIEILPQPVAARNLHFAISKQSPFIRHIPAINEKLVQFQKDGSLELLVNRTIEKAATN